MRELRDFRSGLLEASRGWRERRAEELEVGAVASEVTQARRVREGGPRCGGCERRAREVDGRRARGLVERMRKVQLSTALRRAEREREALEGDGWGDRWGVGAEDPGVPAWMAERLRAGRLVVEAEDRVRWEGATREAVEAAERFRWVSGGDVGGWFGYEARCAKCRVYSGDRSEREKVAGVGTRSSLAASGRVDTRWHSTRAAAWRERGARYRACGAVRIRRSCRSCGEVAGERRIGCGTWVLCGRCAGWKAKKDAAACGSRARGVTESAAASGVGTVYRAGRVLRVSGWRFVTLTVPHVGSTSERAVALVGAWEFWLRCYNAWLDGSLARQVGRSGVFAREALPATRRLLVTRGRDGRERSRDGESVIAAVKSGRDVETVERHWHWVRKWEVTEGDDGRGHFHAHVLMHGPYLPVALCEEWWRIGLRRSGVVVERAIVHVEAVRTADVASEVAKYAAKAALELTAPGVASEVWRWLSRRRVIQPSRGFAAFEEEHVEACGGCGAARCKPGRIAAVARPLLGESSARRAGRVVWEEWSRASERWRAMVVRRRRARVGAVFEVELVANE